MRKSKKENTNNEESKEFNIKKFFDSLEKKAQNKYSSKASEYIMGDINEFISSGNYVLDAALAGSIKNGGIPGNKITTFAGPSTTGKTFLLISLIKSWQDLIPNGEIFYFESEGAITKAMLQSRGIDLERIRFFPVATVEEFRFQTLNILDDYINCTEENKPKLMFVLDSLGQLSTMKEIGDISSGENKVDLTKAKLVRGAFRVLTLKMSIAGVPMIVANHTYSLIGSYVGGETMGGGEGTKYGSTQTIYLSKTREREKDTKDVVGINITAKIDKSRITREGKKVTVYVDYIHGLDKYSGLFELCLEGEIFTREGNTYYYKDKSFSKREIEEHPENIFTEELLEDIEKYVNSEFRFGTITDNEPLEDN